MQHRLALVLLAAACSHSSPTAAPVAVVADAPTPTPRIGIAVVFEMHHLWLGNDSWWSGLPKSRTAGYYGDLQAGLDQLARVDLPDAQVVLIGYGYGASVRWTGPLAELTGDRLGSQASMTSVTQSGGAQVADVGLDVGAGVEEAITDLDRMDVQEKHLIVIGDGNHADSLAADKPALVRDGISADAIYLQEGLGYMPGDPAGWKQLTDDVQLLDRGDAIPSAIVGVATGWKR